MRAKERDKPPAPLIVYVTGFLFQRIKSLLGEPARWFRQIVYERHNNTVQSYNFIRLEICVGHERSKRKKTIKFTAICVVFFFEEFHFRVPSKNR